MQWQAMIHNSIFWFLDLSFKRKSRNLGEKLSQIQGTSRDSSPNVCCNLSQHLGWFESIQHPEIHRNPESLKRIPIYAAIVNMTQVFSLPVTSILRVSWWWAGQGCRVALRTLFFFFSGMKSSIKHTWSTAFSQWLIYGTLTWQNTRRIGKDIH